MPDMPSLKGLRAFEAAARSGSFAAAAIELSVSPAAIGQLIRSLEDQVGRKLFHRVNRGIIPTEAGLEVLPRLSAAFDELKGISRQISGASSHARLTISAPNSVVAGWLSQRIGEFVASHGPIDISLRSDNDPVDFERDMIDIRMSYGRFHYRTHDTHEMVTDAIFPVCAPSFMDRNGPFTTVENLLDTSLIHTDWGPASASFPTWRNWFEAASVSPERQTGQDLVADSSIAAINLAISGLGVTLCQGLLAAQLIADGSLVHAYNLALLQSQPYCLTIPRQSVNRPIVSMFRDWLLLSCKTTVGSPNLYTHRVRCDLTHKLTGDLNH
ncbi:MAG: LysR family transcriptional regulator [Gammaproteobacteria bacterium]|nr:LysR family transcriptional regulator [Gammaproteobacteria bacterium]